MAYLRTLHVVIALLAITTCIRATCTLDKKNNPWITQAAAYIRCKLDHSYERGLYKMQNACINGIWLIRD